ncbi:Solute carrier family 25 [Tolypocladium capitatum]|uniref:Mitochondrial glycine transporter n=1 Tax=Tolypocladium capitatum TaxID=45235 RepID=A0A2K3QP43_9HYPO|nr:Solute carrier family 25 [Tolypocladium capitatum]
MEAQASLALASTTSALGPAPSIGGQDGGAHSPVMNETRSPARANSQPPSSVVSTARHFVSGLGSGVASAVILQPLDLLKTRVQQSGRSSLSACLRDIRQSPHLVRSMWRGTVPSALRTGFGSALYFTSLNAIRQHAQKTGMAGPRLQGHSGSSALPTLSNSANLISGAVARTFAGFVLMPLTVIKVRFESSLYSYPSMWAAAGDIRRADGFRGFFSGFGATAIRDAPYAGMYVLFYEMLKTRLGSLASSSTLSPDTTMQAWVASSVNFSSAILAGAACSAVSNPFDAVKTRIQLQPRRYRNVWQAGYRMVAEDGFRSLWNGLALRMSRKALSSALAWTVYEELIRKSGA